METTLDVSKFNFLQDLWLKAQQFFPKLLLALVFIIVAWIILKIVHFVLKRILKVTKVDDLITKLNEAQIFGKKDLNIVPSNIILKFVKYLLILIFVVIASEMLGLKAVSEGVGKLIAYLPVFITALFIFVVGVYLASLVKNAIKDTFKSLELSGSNLVSNIAFYIIVVVVSITALNQAGINTEIITKNLTLLLGSILISFTIAFGLGSRDVILRLLFGFYSRRNFKVGQTIKTNKIEGVIERIDNICITIKTKENVTVVLPIKDFVDKKIEVL